MYLRKKNRNLIGDPVVKIPSFHHSWCGFDLYIFPVLSNIMLGIRLWFFVCLF